MKTSQRPGSISPVHIPGPPHATRWQKLRQGLLLTLSALSLSACDLNGGVANELGTLHEDDPAVDANSVAPVDQSWWVLNFSHTGCLLDAGPASRIDERTELGETVRTNEYQDWAGQLARVEVVADDNGDTRRTWTYFKGEQNCHAAQVGVAPTLADKYR